MPEGRKRQQRVLAPTSNEELASEIPYVGAPLAHKIESAAQMLIERGAKAVVNEFLPYANDKKEFAFNRFAGRILAEAGAAEINEIPYCADLRVTKQPTTGLARIPFPAHATQDEQQLILAVEATINRALAVANMLVLASQRYAGGDEERVIPVSFGRTFSVSYLAEKRKRDREHQGTPAFERMNSHEPLTETTLPDGLLNLLDWFTFDNIAIDTVATFQCATCPNELISILGTSAARASDWDTRSRFANILEHIAAPTRLRYQFDCDMESATAAVAFEVPPLAAFPAYEYQPESGNWKSIADKAEAARTSYLIRMVGLLAGSCFGSGLPIEHAIVNVYSAGFDTAPVLSCRFERFEFTAQCMEEVRTGRLLDEKLRYDFATCLELVAPIEMAADIAEGGALSPVARLDSATIGRRPDPWSDTRRLPANLARFFHAREARELDTVLYLGGNDTASWIDEAVTDSHDSKIAAIATLESLVDELEAKLPKLSDNERLLYCEHPAARACVSLLDDRASVSAQAQAYLRTGEFNPERTTITSNVRYVRMPNALFNAYAGLADLYQRIRDFDAAEAMADRCITYGPTSATGYLRKADILAERRKFNQAINVLMESLHYLVLEADYAAVYQSLALIHWYTHREKTSIALYALLSYLHDEPAETAKKFIAKAKRTGVIANGRVPEEQAAKVVASAGIPLAPTEQARMCIARAAIELSNAGFYTAAAPYANYLSNFAEGAGGSIALKSVSSSLQFGIDTMDL